MNMWTMYHYIRIYTATYICTYLGTDDFIVVTIRRASLRLAPIISCAFSAGPLSVAEVLESVVTCELCKPLVLIIFDVGIEQNIKL